MSAPREKPSHKDKDKCRYCHRSYARSFAIECAECSNFVLCGDCFSSGVELGTHKNNHKYKVADCLEFPLFVKDWTVSEELALLEGIERHGVGNWKTISDSHVTNKTTRQIEEHYWELYMGVHGYCLPSQVMWKDQVVDTATFCPETKSEGAGATEGEGEAEGEGGVKDELSVSAEDLYRVRVTAGYSRGEPVRRGEGFQGLGSSKATNKDKQVLNEKLAQLPGSDLPGFTPLRGDFDIEYENDADKMLAEMEFSLDEHPSERELKLQVVRIYNHKLQERNRRKQFVIERGLVDFKQQQLLDKRRTKEERELVGKLRVFARFQSREEHEALVEGMLRAGRLRQQIELYRTYRAMGVRTLEQARQFEAAKRVREKDLKARKHRDSAPYLFQPQGGAAAGSSGGSGGDQDGPEEERAATEMGGKGRRRGGRDSSASLSAQGEEGYGPGYGQGGGLTGRKRAAQDDWTQPPYSSRASSSGAGTGAGATMAGLGSPGRGSGAASGQQQQLSAAGEAEAAALLARAPGGDLLSDMELHFCAQVPMLPLHYLAAKDAIVREAYRNGALTQEGVRRLLKLDSDGADRVYDFFVKEMLVNEPPASRSALTASKM